MTLHVDPPDASIVRRGEPTDDRELRVMDLDQADAEMMAAVVRPLDAPTVAVVGLGYVGLPIALGLEEIGSTVIGLEISRSRIAAIRELSVDLVPEDHVRLSTALHGDRLHLTDDSAAIAAADAVIVCVPTPVDASKAPDLDALRGACATVVANARVGQVIILTSTSYVGCTRDLVVDPLTERGFTVGTDVFVAFAPERIDPGRAHYSQRIVPRVIGGTTPACVRRAAEVIGRVAPVHTVSSAEAAEFTKLLENSFRAVNIAFANEMETAAMSLGLQFDEIVAAASTKPFGFMPFQAGVGVGGHCIPCDPHYLLWQLRRERLAAPVLQRAMEGIAARPGEIVDRSIRMLADEGIAIRGASVMIVGVAYKPGVEDMRESPAIEVIERLRAAGADVHYTDALIPAVHLPDGVALLSVADPSALETDLVIVHSMHPGVSHDWLAGRRILDPSGRSAEQYVVP
ncbi:MAG TPA: nucleotide sugar dehydrogenase [Candidatus Limnocylindrales bacterium]